MDKGMYQRLTYIFTIPTSSSRFGPAAWKYTNIECTLALSRPPVEIRSKFEKNDTTYNMAKNNWYKLLVLFYLPSITAIKSPSIKSNF
jgi:hypothetical protein